MSDLQSRLAPLERLMARNRENAASALRRGNEAASRAHEFSKRRSQVWKIKQQFESSVEGCAGDASRVQRSVASMVDEATNGFVREASLVDSARSSCERSVDRDERGSRILIALQSEFDRCKREIDDAEAIIKAANIEIAQCEASYVALRNRAEQIADQYIQEHPGEGVFVSMSIKITSLLFPSVRYTPDIDIPVLFG